MRRVTTASSSSVSRQRKISCERGCDHHDVVSVSPVMMPAAEGSFLSCNSRRPISSSRRRTESQSRDARFGSGMQSSSPVLVELDADHPGFHDPVYRRRRDEIARAALAYRDGDPAPEIAYSGDEHGVWREVWRHLDPLHDRYACGAYRTAAQRVSLSRAS